MKIVGKNKQNHQRRRYIKQSEKRRQLIIIGFSDVHSYKNTDKRNQNHRYIKGIPEVTGKRIGRIKELNLTGSYDHPPYHKKTDGNEHISYLLTDNTDIY